MGIVGIILMGFVLSSGAVNAAEPAQSNISCDQQYPWCGEKNTNIGDLVGKFYKYALALVGVTALGAIIYGGIKYAVSAGNPSAQSDAIQWITGAVWGLVLLLGANLLLRTINPKLTSLEEPKLDGAKIENSKVGIQPNSTIPIDKIPELYALTKTEQAQKNKELSREIIDSGKIKFSTNADCTGFDAKRSISQLARDGVATACSSSCNCNDPVAVNTSLLQITKNLSQKYPITINSITTGKHTPNSLHYKGKAMDMDVPVSQREDVVKDLVKAGFNAFCDKGGDKVSCDKADHIHYSI